MAPTRDIYISMAPTLLLKLQGPRSITAPLGTTSMMLMLCRQKMYEWATATNSDGGSGVRSHNALYASRWSHANDSDFAQSYATHAIVPHVVVSK